MTIGRVALYGATLLFFLGGCSGGRIFGSPIESAKDLAAAHGFEGRIYRVGSFEIVGFARNFAQSSGDLTVYIEGDGAPWRAIDVPPRDPTPQRLLVLELAAKDNRNPLLYLARPCQFLEEGQLRHCASTYWMEKRYSEEVVASIDQAITAAMQDSGAERLNLVGYSGGGTIAVYLAERRNDVASLITIASPVNHAAWTEYHDISPLTGSLGRIRAWEKLEKIPQLHLVGEIDTIVPPALMKSMLPLGAKIKVVPGFDHECCWVRDWKKLLDEADSLKTAN